MSRPDNPSRWQRLKPLLDRALDLAGAERTRFLAELSDEDADLRSDLERLIASKPPTEGDVDSLAAALAPAALTAALGEHEGAEDPRINQVLGHYRLLRVLGEGGMGTVYVAERHDGDFVQKVALKIVEGAGINSAVRARFERERQILASLRHPNIASLFDGGVTPEGLPYYTMEWVQGTDLAEYCREYLPTIEERVCLLIKVATALAYAHLHLVVHRDIKPSNILVTAEGDPKLLDFGIAKLMGEAAGATMTQGTAGPMTREYAAPEQFRGSEITVATDVFQFGTLCYRILSGNWPYGADPADPYAWSRAVSEEEPLPMYRTVKQRGEATTSNQGSNVARATWQLRGDLNAIIQKAIAKAPQDRYWSMDTMIMDLEAYLAGRPVTARRAGMVYYLWRFLARRPYVSIGATAAILALSISTFVALRQAQIASEQALAAQHEAARANSINDFLVDLFKVSDPGVNRSEELIGSEILARRGGQASSDKDQLNPQPPPLTVISDVYARALAVASTGNLMANEHLLRGELQLHRAWATLMDKDFAAADREFAQATALDPEFALAYARRAYGQLSRDWSDEHTRVDRTAEAKEWIERALVLQPGLPAAHSALGYYHYYGLHSYAAALAEFERTIQLAPNDLDALQGKAYIDRRLGKWDEALTLLKRCILISPRDSILFGEYGTSLEVVRRFDDAETQLIGARVLDPNDSNAMDFLLRVRLFGRGDISGARAIGRQLGWRIPYHNVRAGDLFNLVNARVYPDLFDRRFDNAIKEWESAPQDSDEERTTRRVARIAIRLIAGETATLKEECQSVQPLISAKAKADPDLVSVLQQTSWVELCLGHNTAAMAAARHATEVRPLSKDAYWGVYQLEGLAEVAARAGDPEEALRLLEQLLGMTAGQSVTVERLKRDPLWDPLRKDPRFDALLKRHETRN